MKSLSCLSGLVLLTACNAPADPARRAANGQTEADTVVRKPAPVADPLSFTDGTAAAIAFAEPPVLRAQVLLDRLGFSPGVIDGKEGQSYLAALRGFQDANDLDQSGKLDAATQEAMRSFRAVVATRLVVIPPAFADGPFFPDLPETAPEQAKLPALGYRNLMEALAERFHTTPELLIAINAPGSRVGAGKTIRVPNISNTAPLDDVADARGWATTLQKLGVAATQPKATKVVVDKSESVLKVYDAAGDLIAQFPATMGSSRDPLPIGNWKILGVSRNPEFHYNPKLFWDVSDDAEAAILQPGPNGPVGVVWIDLSKPHYGIHGTSAPHTIGRAESHGCVRLTNWDAARLAQMVKPGIEAIFQQ